MDERYHAAVRTIICRLARGWELMHDEADDTWKWYSETKPGFDIEEPTKFEVAVYMMETASLR